MPLALLPCAAFGQTKYDPYKYWPSPKPSDGYYWYLKAGRLLPRKSGEPGSLVSNLSEADMKLVMSKAYPLERGSKLPVTDGRTTHVPWTLYPEVVNLKALAKWSAGVARYDFEEGHTVQGFRWLRTGLRFANHQRPHTAIQLLVQIASRSIC